MLTTNINLIQKITAENGYYYTPPWGSEHTNLYHGKKTYPEAFATKRHDIESKMRVYEPMAEELTNAIGIFKQDSLDFYDVASSTQHEEFDHMQFPSTICSTFEFYDPEQPINQHQGDIGPHLQMHGIAFEDSVKIIQNKMCDNSYRQLVHSLNLCQHISLLLWIMSSHI